MRGGGNTELILELIGPQRWGKRALLSGQCGGEEGGGVGGDRDRDSVEGEGRDGEWTL